MPLHPDATLLIVTQLRQGAGAAELGARLLYDAYWARLVRFFMLHRQPDGQAEELASEVLFKVVLKIHTLREDAAFTGWLWQIARNELAGHTRRNNLEEIQLAEEAWQLALAAMPDEGHGEATVQRCLQGQLERFRQEHPERAFCIEQAVLEGWDGTAMAVFLGRSYGATREYLSQCRKKIAQYLHPCLDTHADLPD